MPTDMDILVREEYELRKLAREEKSVSDDILHAHAKNYSSKYILVYDEDKIFASLRKKIEGFKKNDETPEAFWARVQKEKRDTQEKQSLVLEQLRKEEEIVDLIKFIREQGFLRFEYKEWFMGAEYKFLELFKEIAKRIGLDIETFFLSYGIDDVRRFFTHGEKLSQADIEARKKMYILLQDGNERVFRVGAEAEKFFGEIFDTQGTVSTEVRGVVANRGKAVGRARIILPRDFVQIEEELEHFKEGEVLITTMTQPTLIVVMKKAGAIITDQGGMTSHAAVISREFGVPCIVGTYKATQIFKTGDLLEVDADKGIVRIIKRI